MGLICINQSQQAFYAQMASCAVHYDVIYHPLPINSQYLKTGEGGGGVDSLKTIWYCVIRA